jgi:hypothetical protein
MGMLSPSAALLCKLASVAVHADEMLSADGHDFDRAALKAVLSDPEVIGWVEAMTDASLAPRKRMKDRPHD